MTHRLAWGGAALAVALSACTSSYEGDGAVRLELLSWWASGGERDAVEELQRVHRTRFPNVDIVVMEAANAPRANEQLSALFEYGEQPDCFHANVGSMLLSRVLRFRKETDSLYEGDRQIVPVDDVFEGRRKVWKEANDAVTVWNERYGVPIDIHRINNLYFNIEKLGSRPWPTDVPGLLALLEDLKPEVGDKPFGIGVKDNWTLEALAFENLLPSVTIADGLPLFYEEFWKGERELLPAVATGDSDAAVTRRELDKTLRYFQELWASTTVIGKLDFENGGEGIGEWSDAFDAMMDPDSPVTLVAMGDWATGYLESKGFLQGEHFDVKPFPGTEGLFIFTSDAFALPIGAQHPEATRALLSTVLSREAQIAFNRKKGALPAIELEPGDAAEISPVAEQKLAHFLNGRRALAMSGLVTPYIPPLLLRNALAEMMIETAEGDPATARDIVLHALQNHYWLIKSWTTTVRGG